MIDLILQHAMNTFEMFFLVVYFFLTTCNTRYSNHRSIPQFIIPIITSCQYYLCLAWIALFFSSLLLFKNRPALPHLFGFITLAISFYYMVMYRGAIEVERFKNFRCY